MADPRAVIFIDYRIHQLNSAMSGDSGHGLSDITRGALALLPQHKWLSYRLNKYRLTVRG